MLPQRIGRYRITAEIGRGSASVVYRGVDPVDGRVVAVKTLQRNGADSEGDAPAILQRFRDESHAIGRLGHPGVVAVDEFGEDGLHAWIAMACVEGQALDEVLRRTPLLPLERALAIMDELLDALACVHREGLCHREVKPANLLLTPAGHVKLTDFGVARLRDLGLTRVSTLVATPAYMAPEQFTGAPVDHRADLFACGVLLYTLLAGRRPFAGSPVAVMQQILHEQPPRLGASGGVGAAFDDVVARALAKRPEDRFASAGALRDALRHAAQRIDEAPLATLVGTVVGTLVQDADGVLAHLSSGQRAAFEQARARRLDPMAGVVLRDAPAQAQRVDAFALYLPDAGSCHAIVDIPARQRADDTSVSVAPAVAPVALAHAACVAAQQVLARRIGPVASVIVRRAADAAGGSHAAFIATLVAGVPGPQQAALRAELEAAWALPRDGADVPDA